MHYTVVITNNGIERSIRNISADELVERFARVLVYKEAGLEYHFQNLGGDTYKLEFDTAKGDHIVHTYTPWRRYQEA